MSAGDLFPLLLLSREGLAESGYSRIFNFLIGLYPIVLTCEVERTEGGGDDLMPVTFQMGELATRQTPDQASLGISDGPQLVFGLGRSTKAVYPGGPGGSFRSFQQFTWNVVRGGTFSLNVWLEAAIVGDGRFYQQLDSTMVELKELL
jgi:hypothetical protein